jgi:hypothetical protein
VISGSRTVCSRTSRQKSANVTSSVSGSSARSSHTNRAPGEMVARGTVPSLHDCLLDIVSVHVRCVREAESSAFCDPRRDA